MDWFKKQSNLVQFILLVIPFIGWICELVIRWSVVAKAKQLNVIDLVIALVYTFLGWAWILHLIDAIAVLLGKGLLFIDFAKVA